MQGLLSQTSGGVTTSYGYGYGAGGVRIWSQTVSTKTYYLIDGGTLLGEINPATTNPIAVYTWGGTGLISE